MAGDDGMSPNTNVGGFAGTTWAMVEAGSSPVELGDELDSLGTNRLFGTLPNGFSAHPKYDPATGELHAMAYHWLFTWAPDRPARVGLLPRTGGADDIIWCDVEPCYVFHPLNAHEFGAGRGGAEPVVVPKADGTAEDDAWILTVVYDPATDASELCILDAQDIAGAEVARIQLPQRVPFGFHGNWVSDTSVAPPA